MLRWNSGFINWQEEQEEQSGSSAFATRAHSTALDCVVYVCLCVSFLCARVWLPRVNTISYKIIREEKCKCGKPSPTRARLANGRRRKELDKGKAQPTFLWEMCWKCRSVWIDSISKSFFELSIFCSCLSGNSTVLLHANRQGFQLCDLQIFCLNLKSRNCLPASSINQWCPEWPCRCD